MEDQSLVVATYFLVGATALLVLASVAPVVQRWLDVRTHRSSDAAKLVPDMNLLRQRLEIMVNTMIARTTFNLPQLDSVYSEIEVDLKRAASMAEGAYTIQLKFVNELYMVRHFITCAADDMKVLIKAAETDEKKSKHHDHLGTSPAPHQSDGNLSEEGRIQKIAGSYQAALISIRSAEELLPKSVRTVDGQSFWDRYSSTIDKRSTEAEKALVDLKSERGRRS